jgi:hypothetical protein
LPRLTIDRARHLEYESFVDEVYALIEPYESRHDGETQQELERRISKTLDELPDVYAWINQLHAWFDHWTDFWYRQDKTSLEYKAFRNKRDMLEKAASSAKLRYEGTSRRLTQVLGQQEETRMPRGRG